MQDLTISLVQTELHWEDIPSNLASLKEKIDGIEQYGDLILLPEMFSTGFTMKPAENAEEAGGPAMQWMAGVAAEKTCVLAGSLIISENGRYYNRFVWMRPDGSYEYYNKKHLFRMGEEHLHYSAGNEQLIVEIRGWKLMPLVCYDLRFPVWSRNTFRNGQYAYDLLVYVANWPAARALSWTSLLQARAIENMAFSAGLNRVGTDGRGYVYSGDSMVTSPDGSILKKLPENIDMTATVRLKHEILSEIRTKLGVGNDWDSFSMDC